MAECGDEVAAELRGLGTAAVAVNGNVVGADFRAFAKEQSAAGMCRHRKVVNVSSITGLFGNADQPGYSAGKAAVVGPTQTLAKKWGRYDVNAVAFGLIEMCLTQPIGARSVTINVSGKNIALGIQPALLDVWAKTIPLGRASTPGKAAGAVDLFCTPESDYITGQVLLCGGGLTG